MVSLGCARNLVDSEVLLGHAAGAGLELVLEPADADVVVVNTCGFVEDAKQESIDTILEACRLKSEGRVRGVVAVGCLAQRYADELRAEIPELDAVLGISDYSGVPRLLRDLVSGRRRHAAATADGGAPKSAASDLDRVLLTPSSYAYLRISEGCDHTCTFCAIPKMRGRHRSKPPDVVVEEARRLAGQGVKELVVVAEDSTAYGLDLERRRLVVPLLRRLTEIEGIAWVRLMYAYPHTVQSELTALMAASEELVSYLDIPIQHVSGPMLRAMRRGVSAAQVKDVLWRLRDEVPGIVVRTTLIVGFPGETEEDFAELRDFVTDYRFERLGVFVYSPEEGTPAFDLPGRVPAEVAERRRDEIMRIQREICAARNSSLVGAELEVLVDGRAPDGSGWIGRTRADAPEVDGVVHLPASAPLRSGELILARIVAADDYDLQAEPLAACSNGSSPSS